MTKGGRNNKPRRLFASFMRAVPVVAMMLAASQALYMVGVLAAGEFSVSLTDSLFTDVNGNLQVNMGDTVQYTAAITNTSGSAQTTVAYSNTIDSNTTLVPGSVKTTPIARNDGGHSTVGNVQLSVAAPGVLTNDSDPDGGALTMNGVNGCADVTAPFVCAAASANGGDVTLNADGSFTFNPAPGFSGTDTFTYTVRDADSNTDPATVSITVGTPVWFINSSSPGPGDGRFTSPFSSVANYNTTAADDPGDTIFVYQGAGAYTGTLTLLNTQQLIGHGVGLTVAPNLSIAVGTRPTLANITLASGNTVRGLNVSASSGTGISGGSVGALTINNASVTNAAGTAVSLTGGALTVTFDSVSATGGASGIILATTTGSFTANGGTISASTSDGISLTNVTNITLSGMTISGSARHGINGTLVNTLSLTNVALTNVGDADAEDALFFATPNAANLTGTLTMTNVDITNFTERGLSVINNSGNLNATINNTSSFTDNHDTFGSNAIHVESAGSAGITLTVNGTAFDNIESYSVNFIGGGSGTNLLSVSNTNTTNSGGGDNFPSGGLVQLFSQNNAVTRFTINANTITDAIEGVVIATAGPTQAGNLDGTISNNIISMDAVAGVGDGIRLAVDGFSAADDATFTIAVTGNTIDLNSVGDDGIQVLHRDHLGDLYLRIENNTIRETLSEAIRYFSDEDLGVFAAGSPSAQILFANNVLTAIDVDNNENEVYFGTDDEAFACVHMTGNSFGNINFNVATTSQTQITQANTGALSGANGGSTVSISAGALLFNGGCTNPPMPTAFTIPTLADEPTFVAPQAAAGVSSQASLPAVGDFFASLGAQTSRFINGVIESARVQPAHASGETVNVSLGNFDIGQAVTITYRVTVDNPVSPVGATQISTQGTLSAASITSILSDDPAVGGATDPTVTPLADETPPDTSITVAPPDPSNDATPSFTFSGSDNITLPANLTFQCRMDSDPFASCTSVHTTAALGGGSHTFEVKATDQAGNTDASPASYTWTVDLTAPDVTVEEAAGQVDPTNLSPVEFTATFTESVTGFDSTDVTVGGTALPTTALVTEIAPNDGTTYKIEVSGMSVKGTVTASIDASKATDAAGNGNDASTSADNEVTFDAFPSAVTIEQAAGQLDPTGSSPIEFTATFDEPVSGFDSTDVTVGGTANPTTSIVTEIAPMDGTTYKVEVSGMTNDGTVTASINANAAQDALGNLSAASTSGDNQVTFDAASPSVTVEEAAGQADPTGSSPIEFTAVFTELVTGFDGSDVTVGGTANPTTAVVTEIAPMNGTTYKVEVSGMANDGTVTASIDANKVLDVASNGNNASTSADNEVTYDATAPDVTVEQAVTDPTNVSPIEFTATFTEPVSGFDGSDVTVGGSANPTTATVTEIAPMDGTTYKVEVSGMANDGTVTASIDANKAADAAGNGNDASTSADNTVTYDVTAPDVTVEQAAGQLDPTSVSPIEFTATFTEPVTGFDGADVTVGGSANPTTATVTEIAPNDGTTYKVEVSGMANDGTVTASIDANKAKDAAGNSNTASTSGDNQVLYDATPPDVTIDQAATQLDPTNSSTIEFTAVFTELVTGFDGTDVTVGGTANPTTAVVTEIAPMDGTTYKVEVSGMANDGTVTASIDANKVQDVAGKPNNASTSGDNQVLYDATAPDVTIEEAAGQADPTNVSPIEFTVTFTESVTGFDGSDVTLGGGANPTTATVTEIAPNNGTTYKVEVSGMANDGIVTASLLAGVALDDAGNGNTASTSADNQVTYDGTAPQTTIDPPTPADPTNATSATLFFSAADDVSAPDFLTFKCSFDGSAYATCTSPQNFTSLADGPHTFSVKATDTVGNEDATPATHTWTVDNVAPTGVMTSTATDPTNVAPIPVTVQFSETVTGFDASDMDVLVNASVSDFAMVDGDTYTFNLNPLGQGTVSATISAGRFADVGGLNFNADPISFTIVYDSANPTVTVEQAAGQADPTGSSPIKFTATFNEPVIGFASSDVTVGGTALPTTAVVTEIAPNDGTTYKVEVSGMTALGTVTASIPALAAQDEAGNKNDASTSLDNTVEFIDDQAPETVINSGPVNPTNSGNASFTFSGTDNYTAPGALTFECMLDGGGFSSCSSAKTYSGLADGWHIFKVRAVDASGNKDATPATHTWKIDTARPSVTINQAASQSDPTNATQIRFTAVFSEPVSGFTGADVTISGTAGATTATVTGGPVTYTVKVSGMTSAGSVVVTIGANKATDTAGNDNTASTSTDNRVTYHPDGIAPNTVINSHPDNATTSKQAVFTFSGTDNITPANALTFECQLDGGGFSSCASPKTYNNLALGLHTFKVRAKDAAGNVDATPATFTWEITTSADVTTINMACGAPTPITGKINFRLLDPEGDLLTMTFVSSSNQNLVPNANVHINGLGEIRTVVITGAPGVSGVSVVTFHLSDGRSITPLVITFKVGTNGNNTINGTSGIDMIFGLNGADVINGGGGDDLLCGGTGDDTLNGDADNDTLFGGEGDDTLNGGLGDDTLRGANGVDVLTGNAGKDHFSGGPGLDEIVDYTPSEGDTKDSSTP